MKNTTRNRADRVLSAMLLASVLALPLTGCGRSGKAPEPEVETGPAHPPERQPPREVPRQGPPEEQPQNPPPGD